MMTHTGTSKKDMRTRRRARIRAAISGTAERPRLAVFRSNRFISAQLIDDTAGKTIASAHGRDMKGAPAAQAKMVGEAIAKAAKEKGISSAVFDRAGFRFAGNVKAVAEAAREGGLTF